MSNWSTKAQAIVELRTQMQDDGEHQRYTDSELVKALDEAISELSAARPIVKTIEATLGSSLAVRLDNQIGAMVFGKVVSVLDVTDAGDQVAVHGWQYYETGGQHWLLLPDNASGDVVEIQVRGGYGFGIAITVGGSAVTVDCNIPYEWREKVVQGAQGYVLELYGAREVGRTNVAPAVAQQTARAASVKLRDYRQWITSLPYADEGSQFVTWGLSAADSSDGVHRGFD